MSQITIIQAYGGDSGEAWPLERLRYNFDETTSRVSILALRGRWTGAINALHYHKGGPTTWLRSESDRQRFRHLICAEWRKLGWWIMITNKLGTALLSPGDHQKRLCLLRIKRQLKENLTVT